MLINKLSKVGCVKGIGSMISEWISVKEKLPEKGDHTEYLLTDGKHCYVGHYRHKAKVWDHAKLGWVQGTCADTGEPYDIAITHWMPLPELPTHE